MSAQPDINISESATSPADKVLLLPELAAKILDELDTCDLFRASAVCRTWKTVFDETKSLQVKADLEKDLDAGYREEVFDKELGLEITYSTVMLAKNGTLDVDVYFNFESHVLIQVTLNLRKCLASQPACKELSVEPRCCAGEWQIIRRETGVTITKYCRCCKACPRRAPKLP